MRLSILAAAALAAATPAAAAPADDFHRLLDEHYRWLLRESSDLRDRARRARL